jgi:hypothetical protein
MQKLFDKILSEKIKKVFNNHQETYDPADWEKLKMQLTGKKRGLIIWMQIAKAASVVLFVGVSTFYANKNDIKPQFGNIDNIGQTSINIAKSTETTAKSIQQNHNNVEADRPTNKYTTNGNQQASENNITLNEIIHKKNITKHNRACSGKKEQAVTVAENINTDSLKQVLQTQLSEFEPEIINEKQPSKFDFALALASIYSYSSQGTKGSINMGGGITASYNLSEKLSISTGLLVAKQSVDYSNSSDLVFANTADRYEASINTLNNGSNTDSKIEFVGLDIPLNIKYKIKKLIITTGISSLVYISEKKSYTTNEMLTNTLFNSVTNSYETVNTLQNVQLEENAPAFSSMDFASLFNLSIGYQLPLNKGSIIFEPFIKYPLGEISSANIKIASGGLSVQYYF